MMTKRKWRRMRGKMIGRVPSLCRLRSLKYSAWMMESMVKTFDHPAFYRDMEIVQELRRKHSHGQPKA